MKKKMFVAVAAVLAISMLAGCGASSKSNTNSENSSSIAQTGEQTATYNVVNTTGETVTELYLYKAGSEDKGENRANAGLAADASVVLTDTAAADEVEGITYVLEFTTESGATQKFETLNFEEVNIELLSVDAAAGATPIVFGALQK